MALSEADATRAFLQKLIPIFQISAQIGTGAHGTVHRATVRANKLTVALKFVYGGDRHYLTVLHTLRELKYMSKFKHRNVMGIRNVYGMKGEMFAVLCIVMDFMTCALTKCIEEPHLYFPSLDEKKNCLFQFLNGLVYLHSAEIVHRDIKPGNILCKIEPRLYKITDFDHARKIGGEPEDCNMTGFVGTLTHLAPEIALKPCHHRSSMDVYSAGLVFLEVLTLKYPYISSSAAMNRVEDILSITGTPNEDDLTDIDNAEDKEYITLMAKEKPRRTWIEIVDGIGATEASLLDQMLHFSASRRCTAADALLSEYFAPLRTPEWRFPKYVGENLSDYVNGMDILNVLHQMKDCITKDLSV